MLLSTTNYGIFAHSLQGADALPIPIASLLRHPESPFSAHIARRARILAFTPPIATMVPYTRLAEGAMASYLVRSARLIVLPCLFLAILASAQDCTASTGTCTTGRTATARCSATAGSAADRHRLHHQHWQEVSPGRMSLLEQEQDPYGVEQRDGELRGVQRM